MAGYTRVCPKSSPHQIIAETSDYLHAECATAIFGFVDDLEVHLRVAEGVIAVSRRRGLATVTWESIASGSRIYAHC